MIDDAYAGRDWERGRLGLAGFFSAAASLTTSDLNAERVLRRRIGFASDFKSAINSQHLLGCTRKRKLARDSSLEGDGFELSVPPEGQRPARDHFTSRRSTLIP